MTDRISQLMGRLPEEIDAVLTARRNGDLHRRCIGVGLPRDVQNVLNGVNELIDRSN